MYFIKYILFFIVILIIYPEITLLFQNQFQGFFINAFTNNISNIWYLFNMYPIMVQTCEIYNTQIKFFNIFYEKNEMCSSTSWIFENNAMSLPISVLNYYNSGQQPMRITVPTLTNTGSDLIIEGIGFIPFEEVQIKLIIDWSSPSSQFNSKSIVLGKIIKANSNGNFETKLKVPETPLHTTGNGKYIIKGMESNKEQISFGTFLTSDTKFSFRQ